MLRNVFYNEESYMQFEYGMAFELPVFAPSKQKLGKMRGIRDRHALLITNENLS